MYNCSQNCWIDWNSAMLCFKRLFHIGGWTFTWFMRPLLATILCVWQIWSGSNNSVYILSRISLVGNTKITKTNKQTNKQINKQTRHRTDFEADLWPELNVDYGKLGWQTTWRPSVLKRQLSSLNWHIIHYILKATDNASHRNYTN